jgi:glycosyltransferase involved in cell wall biosynthesis
MKVLHLVSNRKLTGPVDPAIHLARALQELDVDSRVAVGRPQPGEGPIDHLVRERGIEPITELCLPKHRRLWANRADLLRLLPMLEADPVDVIHAHLDNAHGLSLRARRGLAEATPRVLGSPVATGPRPLIVRSLYDDEIPRSSLRYRWLYGRATDGVFVFGERLRRTLVERFGLSEEQVVKLDGAVSTERFRVRNHDENLRERLGIPREAVVVGIVARIQRHRRFEVLLEAVQRVMKKLPEVRLLILGRGTHARRLAHTRARELGITDRVFLPGYVGGEDYPAALSCFDMKIFLVPGSDGTCRAVREAMASGIPVIASRRGLLPEIVRHEVDGLVVEDEVEPLERAIEKLAGDANLRRQFGEKALQRAREEFSLMRQAETVLGAYRRWMGK